MALSREEAAARLAEVGIAAADARRRVGTWSTGMRQRLAFASVTADPNVRYVLLDEPTSGLDPEGIRLLLDRVVSLADRGLGIVVSSHRLAELEPVVTRTVLIVEGTSRPLEEVAVTRVVRVRAPDLQLAERALAERGLACARIGRLLVVADAGDDEKALAAALDGLGAEVVEVAEPTLEELFFLHLRGRRS